MAYQQEVMVPHCQWSLYLLNHLSLQSGAQREQAVHIAWKYLFDVPGLEE